MSPTLYLKYRPQDFDSIVGQEMIRITLKNASKDGKLSHAYLFTGPRGTGKTSMARIVAKAINCISKRPDGNPCNHCNICKSITDGRLVDIIEIDAASHTGVDDVRDIIDKARFMPNEAKKKVYIIDEVHMLSKAAFNALLKTLEEPPEHVHFILATTELHKIPETIISRCQKFDFKRIEIKDIVYYLKYIAEQEKVEVDVKALNLIAKVAEGGMRNAIGLFEKVITDHHIIYDDVVGNLDITGLHIIEGLYDDIAHQRVQTALLKISDLYESGASLAQFTKDFISYLRDNFLESMKNADISSAQRLVGWIDICGVAFNDLKNAIVPQLPLEIAIAKMCLGKTQEVTSLATPTAEEKQIPKKEETEKKPEQDHPKKEDLQKEPITLTLESIQAQWIFLCSHIPSPKNKMAFKNASPIKLEKTIITIAVNSKMMLEVLKSTSAEKEMEHVLLTHFDKPLRYKVIIEKIDHITTSSTSSQALSEPETLTNPHISIEDVTDMFGGTIMEG